MRLRDQIKPRGEREGWQSGGQICVVYATLSASVALLYCYLQHICVVGQQAGQRPRNLCGIYNTFGITAHNLLRFAMHLEGSKTRGRSLWYMQRSRHQCSFFILTLRAFRRAYFPDSNLCISKLLSYVEKDNLKTI